MCYCNRLLLCVLFSYPKQAQSLLFELWQAVFKSISKFIRFTFCVIRLKYGLHFLATHTMPMLADMEFLKLFEGKP